MGLDAVGPRVDLRAVGAVAAGGALGGCGRYLVDLAVPHAAAGFPWSTLIVNVAGAFVLAWLLAWHRCGWQYLRHFAAVGFLGSFTTFSTLALQVRELLAAGDAPQALLYAGLTILAGLTAACLGLLAGTRRRRPPAGPQLLGTDGGP